MFALFNIDKNFIGYSSDIPESSNVLKREIPEEKSDMAIWRWDGDYDNGRMIFSDIGYPVEEIEIEKQMFDHIGKKYPLPIQLINIIKQLRKITKENDDIEDYQFADMADYIVNAVDKYNKRVNYYKNYSKLISKNESEEEFKRAFTNQ